MSNAKYIDLLHFTAHYCTLLHITFANIAHFGDFSTLPNVVGYAQSPLCNGHKALASQFIGIGAGKVSLDSLRPVGNVETDEVIVDILGPTGVPEASYYWINWGGETGDQECWSQEASGDVAEGVILEPSQGLWVTGTSNEQALQSSGEVLTKDISVQLCNGHVMTGNPYPVAISLDQCVPTGNVGTDEVIVEILGSTGVPEASYYWINWGGESGDQECWSLDASGDVAEEVIIEPGQGLWVTGASEEQYLEIAAPDFNF